MARSMPSEHIELLIAGYVLGDLDRDEAAEFERLLGENPAIAQEVVRMQEALELTYTPPVVEPPAHLRSAIMNANVHEATPRRSSDFGVRASRSPFPWGMTAGVAAAVLIVALGVNNYRLWQALEVARTETQQLDILTYSLQGTKAANPASATLVVNPNNLEARLKVKDLPPLPFGKTYVLWTVLRQGAPFTTDDKAAILTEVFNVDAQGNVSRTITVPEVYRSKELVAKIAVTMEDAASPQNHKESPILITSL